MVLSRNVLILSICLVSLLGLLQAGEQTTDATSDFAFLQPWFDLRRDERAKLVQRRVVVRGLQGHGKQIGVIAASAIAMSPDAFISRVRAAGGLKSPDALGGRFDDPPALENLARLSLDEGDLDRLRRCRPGDCRLNLSDHEISGVRQALAANSGGSTSQANQVFRQVVLDRARRYQSGGLKSLPDYHDRREPVRPAVIFSEILQQTPYLKSDVPGIAAYLEQFPFGDAAGSESSLQWSRVMINDKAVVMVTHLSIFRPPPGPRVPTVLVAGKQVYASRYMNGELTLTMLFAGTGGSPAYLVHVHRSQLDELEGTFSGLKRSVIEGRIKEAAARTLGALRDSLERGS